MPSGKETRKKNAQNRCFIPNAILTLLLIEAQSTKVGTASKQNAKKEIGFVKASSDHTNNFVTGDMTCYLVEVLHIWDYKVVNSFPFTDIVWVCFFSCFSA